MGKTKKTKKFAKIKRILNPKDKRLKSINESLKKKRTIRKFQKQHNKRFRNKRTRTKSNSPLFFL